VSTDTRAGLDRRSVLLLAALGWAVPARLLAGGAAPLRLWSAASDREDRHFLIGFAVQDGALQAFARLPLPERGHHVASAPSRSLLVSVARRPGTSLVLVDATTASITAELRVPADRHLYGHGVFSPDGDWFYTTENAFDEPGDSSGRLVRWRVSGHGASAALTRVDEFPTGGTGPHELLLLPDGNTLVIANGGIRTHPSRDRDILNLDTMQPSLAYVDRHTGRLLEQHFLPAEFHQSSIRHLDANAAGEVVLGMQFEGEAFLTVPLLATHRRGEALRPLLASVELQPRLQQYVGSVRFARDGRHVAATCPRGNLLTVWDTDSGQVVQQLRARDNCGVYATAKGFLYSTGMGKVAELDLGTGALEELADAEALDLLWDNHLCADLPTV
jgi:uncharacterized protein